MAAGRYVFQCAEDAQREITAIFDFVQPTVVALWNLRWQVQGFLSLVPNASSDDLANRFALGSEMRGLELKRACVDTPWERQKSEFAEFILSSLIAAFEDYTGKLADKGNKSLSRKVSKGLQFPPSKLGSAKDGAPWALAILNKPSSSLQGVFRPGCTAHPRYAGNNLQNLLICYRFFKCMRNMVAHNGGRADQETVDAYARFAAVANVAKLGLPEVPKHHPVNLNQPITLELRGVIGLSDVVLRLIRSFDAELSESVIAESEVKLRVKPIPTKTQFAKKGASERIVDKLIYCGGLPRPKLTQPFISFLKRERIVPHFW